MQLFHLPVAPVAKGRPRTVVRAGVPIVYTPTPTRKAEKVIRDLLIAAGATCYPRWAPVKLVVTFAVRKPIKAPGYLQQPPRRPDLTNYLMLIADAGTGVLWMDDAQLVSIVAEKRYAPADVDAPDGYVTLRVSAVPVDRPFRHRKPDRPLQPRKRRAIVVPLQRKGGTEGDSGSPSQERDQEQEQEQEQRDGASGA